MNIFVKIYNLANVLDQKGLYKEADILDIMLAKGTQEQYLADHFQIPDNQRNTSNQGYIGGDGVGGGYSGLHVPMIGQPADDGNYNPYKELYELNVKENERLMHFVKKLQKENNQLHIILDAIKDMHLTPVDKYFERFVTKKPEEQDNVDAAARSIGLQESSVMETAGFAGFLGDSFFYKQPGSMEDNI